MPLKGPYWALVRGGIWGVLLPSGLTIASAIFIKDHVFEGTWITGSSMAPTLSPNFKTSKAQDFVLWKQWQPTCNLQRSDVVLFNAPHNPDRTAVKRIVALGGDTVILDPKRRPDGVLNGRANPAAKSWDLRRGKVQVPEGHLWVEGDNIEKTLDSNTYGPISESLILGKALAVIWPPNQFAQKPWEGYKSATKVVKGSFERRVLEERDQDSQAQAVWKPDG
ncbi:Mitochondrial inner membrane protease subunit 2 [Fulvia fulva]|uniref:Mitochondrial inner membrane protease subunit n=1 Tax=Passalora fulva TaxID=5499 RepID=A0A9Q8L9H3_PASFU|nr:Mitochondrial inner membrane protease subunit 2 [Fulvia fulva]KAK4631887.1 Mitochondrial inner membrane protease subunit 2 [Fulvia fulva]KAK4633563.1 Mitochondrial inner membrane protease subunit 2 [Fulvia fulva]UJO13255.1 Mitochondrial inner membrane protease subunit 2 [Fulvia fulva]WPV11818.1 Mitochondrial inner membrane protease subunit 2 [Fulvia fulva]WPV26934.1 Mitochondrial inner membrane protease subunit 2 [Fulvia fulva]